MGNEPTTIKEKDSASISRDIFFYPPEKDQIVT